MLGLDLLEQFEVMSGISSSKVRTDGDGDETEQVVESPLCEL